MTERTPLEGDTAIVTGASAGIGAATVGTLAASGANVVLAARREDRLEDVAATAEAVHDVETLVVPTDVTDEGDVETLLSRTIDVFGGLDALVNNAGLARGSNIEDLSTDQYREMMAVNTDGMFFTTRAALPHLRETAGTLVFIGSFAGKFPRPFNPVYAATKWWTRGFAKSVSAAVGADDIAVTVINPSEVRTEFGSEDGTAFEERFGAGEVTEPEEIADAVVFAVEQDQSMVSEMDLYRRDKFDFF
ncbi:SDR family oxidoreductase [Halanaeroarchaeum sulfurireducens]|uniref:Oxidoreductase n=1 Tax=Halanaeroarchaeum sulfurireducens TaxID=1604004 RepID=A0A0F7P935_9EURY|nr:SDR family oxidoreductase [Halanaeroarchaeum sulfurireducens]AKH97267.1 oxidoreductase [Halanaeroarchaeum sulfurireducens]ALG81669.1 oxidoreductase [Halanaeroarchaeum sulfurireducens]